MSEEEHNRNPAVDEEPSDEAVEAVAEEPVADEAVMDDLATQLEALAIERDRLAAENDELRNQLLRRQADFENFRKRVENDREDFARFAGMETIRELLPVLDDFQRAVEAAPDTGGPESEFIRGIEIIYQRFVDLLKKLGLEPIDSVGQPFDPNVHHAVETVETDEADDHTVLEEWQKGYNFKGRLLREAMVRVAVQPTETPEAKDSE